MKNPNIRFTKARLLPIALLALVMLPAGRLPAQSTGQLYALGIHMGFASFQASTLLDKTDPGERPIALTLDSVKDAAILKHQVNADFSSVRVPVHTGMILADDRLEELVQGLQLLLENAHTTAKKPDQNWLDRLANVLLQLGRDDPADAKDFVEVHRAIYNSIVAARDSYTAQLAKAGRSDLVHAYVLGVNLAIAEGQATAGETARQIVYSSLINAKPEAQALALDLSPLEECTSLANTTTPMTEVYAKILSLRSVYQSSLR